MIHIKVIWYQYSRKQSQSSNMVNNEGKTQKSGLKIVRKKSMCHTTDVSISIDVVKMLPSL